MCSENFANVKKAKAQHVHSNAMWLIPKRNGSRSEFVVKMFIVAALRLTMKLRWDLWHLSWFMFRFLRSPRKRFIALRGSTWAMRLLKFACERRAISSSAFGQRLMIGTMTLCLLVSPQQLSMDLPPDKAKLLKNYDNEKKWDIICDQVSGWRRFVELFMLDCWGRCCEVKAVVDDEFLVKIFQIINIDFETIWVLQKLEKFEEIPVSFLSFLKVF